MNNITNIKDLSNLINDNFKNSTVEDTYIKFSNQFPDLVNDIHLIFLFDYNINIDKFNGLKKSEINNINIINDSEHKSISRSQQKKLREHILNKFGKCVISGKTGNLRLDCAHIKPFEKCDNKEKYDFNNALLLTKDIHAYFDNYDISINPITYKVEVNHNGENTFLKKYDGKIVDKLNEKNRPYLNHHYKIFLNKKYNLM